MNAEQITILEIIIEIYVIIIFKIRINRFSFWTQVLSKVLHFFDFMQSKTFLIINIIFINQEILFS